MEQQYQMIFKRRSFHKFKETLTLSESELKQIEEIIKNLKPLNDDIKTEIFIVPSKKTTYRLGGEYCILMYSEKKEGYLRNIGYMGEQLDLQLAAMNVGALWLGLGLPEKMKSHGLSYVIMMAISRVTEDNFREDMFKISRKTAREVWDGDYDDIANIVRFAPSACNSQPWFVESRDNLLKVYRYNDQRRKGIMSVNKAMYFNKIDIGIFMYFLELCLEDKKLPFERALFDDTDDKTAVKTLIAEYRLA